MPLDDLVSVIETLQQRIREHGDTLRGHETRTRTALVNPLLTALGWDVSDPSTVTPEYNVGSQRADYALLGVDGKPAATIEAKKLGESLASHRMQMLNYSNASGVEYAGLTDGDHWELYEVFQRGQLEDRRVLEVSVASMPAHEIALKMLLLWRLNLASGQPAAANSRITTPAAVEPKPMVTVVAKPASLPPAVSTPSTGWIPLSSLTVKSGHSPPLRIRFADGTERGVSSWNQLLLRISEWLVEGGKLTSGNVPVFSGGTAGPSFGYCIVNTEPKHPNGKSFGTPVLIGGSSLVMNGPSGTSPSVGNARTLLQHCGIDPADVLLLLN